MFSVSSVTMVTCTSSLESSSTVKVSPSCIRAMQSSELSLGVLLLVVCLPTQAPDQSPSKNQSKKCWDTVVVCMTCKREIAGLSRALGLCSGVVFLGKALHPCALWRHSGKWAPGGTGKACLKGF